MSHKKRLTKQFSADKDDEEAKQEEKNQKDRQNLLEAKRAEITNYD